MEILDEAGNLRIVLGGIHPQLTEAMARVKSMIHSRYVGGPDVSLEPERQNAPQIWMYDNVGRLRIALGLLADPEDLGSSPSIPAMVGSYPRLAFFPESPDSGSLALVHHGIDGYLSVVAGEDEPGRGRPAIALQAHPDGGKLQLRGTPPTVDWKGPRAGLFLNESAIWFRAQDTEVFGLPLITLDIDREWDLKRGFGKWEGPRLQFFDLRGRLRSDVVVRNEDVRWSLRDDKLVPRLSLGNAELFTTQTGAVEKRPLSSIVGFDKKGNVTWRRQ